MKQAIPLARAARLVTATTVLAASLLSACGGGGGGGAAPGTAPPAPVISLSSGIKTLVFDWAAVPEATHYQLLEELQGGDYVQVGNDIPAATTHYEHTVPLWTRVLAHYVLQACNAAGCSKSAAQTWSLGAMNAAIGYVKASNTGASDVFGGAVALSADGSTLAVGAAFEDSAATGIDGNGADNSAGAAGAVYIYARQGNQWAFQAYVKASNVGDGDLFGTALSLSADGNTLAVGASGEDSSAFGSNGDQASNASANSGAVYVFQRSAGTWSQGTYLKASNTQPQAQFGSAVALSADGSTLVVGARTESGNATGVNGVPANFNASGSGAAYVYRRTQTSWIVQAYLKSNQADNGDNFGTAVAISHDGNRVAVGAPFEDGAATGVGGELNNAALNSGAVFLFARNGNVWSTEAYVKASNTSPDDAFGSKLALSGDGTTMVVGAPDEDSRAVGINGDEADESVQDSGAAYAFDLQGGVWSQRTYIKASNTAPASHFGISLALSFDGRQLAIGADSESNSGLGFNANYAADDQAVVGSGAVYMLQRVGIAWQINRYMKASNANAGDLFGSALALSADGTTLAVGARYEDSNALGLAGNPNDATASEAGAVYLF